MNLLRIFEVRMYQTEITGQILQTADFIIIAGRIWKNTKNENCR